MFTIGQLVWVSLRGRKGAATITETQTGWFRVRYLERGRDEPWIAPVNLEPMEIIDCGEVPAGYYP